MSDKDTPKNRVVNDPEPSTAPSWSEDSTLSTQASLNGADGTIDDETGLEEIPLDELAVEIDHKANQSPVGSRSTMECTDDSQGWEDINLEELQSVSEIKPKAHVLSRDEQLVLLCQAIRNRDIEAAELRRRLHDFDRARELRAAIYAPVYYGIFGVYSYLEGRVLTEIYFDQVRYSLPCDCHRLARRLGMGIGRGLATLVSAALRELVRL